MNATDAISLASEPSWTMQVLGIALWTGLGLLTLSLLVLMRTRWGQAKPLSKCVALSVLAHVLLIGYAYGTRLIFDSGASGEQQPIKLAFITHEQQHDAPAKRDDPWLRLPSDAPMAAILPNSPGRLGNAEIATVARAAPMEQDAAAATDQALPVGQTRSTIERDAPMPELAATRRAPAPVAPLPENENPTPKPQTPRGELPAPRTDDLVRPLPRILTPAPLERQTKRTPAETTDDAVADLAQLAELPTAVDHAAAAPAPRDQTAESIYKGLAKPALTATSSLATGQTSRHSARDALPSRAELTSTVSVTKTVDHPRRLGDGRPAPAPFRARWSRDRRAVIRRFGGQEGSEDAVDASLVWLAAAQRPDGRWDASQFGGGADANQREHDREGAGAYADTGVSGLALLCFLARGHTHMEGVYRQTVQRGLEFLLRSQAADGSLAGDARLYARMYCHAMASIALTEAYGMTGDSRIKPAAERAVDYSVRAQDLVGGGWRYQPGDQGDMSQFGWQVMLLYSAQHGGIETPQTSREGMRRFLRTAAAGREGGLAAYRPGEQTTAAMTAEALLCRTLLDSASAPATREASAMLLRHLPSEGKANLYYWYYASLALFLQQDPAWGPFSKALTKQLLRRQSTEGAAAGSWPPDTVWGGYGGRVYSTAMATLSLQVCYRYQPILSDKTALRESWGPGGQRLHR